MKVESLETDDSFAPYILQAQKDLRALTSIMQYTECMVPADHITTETQTLDWLDGEE